MCFGNIKFTTRGMKKCDDFHGKLGYVYEYQILFLSASVQEL
jgi:hypothetical protein